MSDSRNFNLLFNAAEVGNLPALNFLLEKDFDVNTLVEGQKAIDLAWENHHEDAVLLLLKSNSVYPQNFELSRVTNSNELRIFVTTTLFFHTSIANGSVADVREVLQNLPNMRYFYDPQNNSAITNALNSKQFEVYNVLMDENLEFGPFEDFNAVFNELNLEEKRNLRDTHLNYTQELTEKDTITLMSNSVVGHGNLNEHKRFELVMRAYKFLNSIALIRLILQIVAASRNFKIIFDFNNENVRFMDPTASSNTNGLIYFSGRIYIAAKQLLCETTKHIVYGVLAHELCHYAMFLTFDNHARPYSESDEEATRQFLQVFNLRENIYSDFSA